VYIIFQTTAKKHPETKRDTWPWSDQCGPANVLEFVEGFTQEPLRFFVIKAVRCARNVHLLACPRQVGVPVSHLDSWTAWRDNSQVNAQVVRSWCETWQGYIRIIIACFFFLNHHIRQYNAPLKTVIHHNAELGMARTLLRSWRVILLCNSILLISNIPLLVRNTCKSPTKPCLGLFHRRIEILDSDHPFWVPKMYTRMGCNPMKFTRRCSPKHGDDACLPCWTSRHRHCMPHLLIQHGQSYPLQFSLPWLENSSN